MFSKTIQRYNLQISSLVVFLMLTQHVEVRTEHVVAVTYAFNVITYIGSCSEKKNNNLC